MYVIADADAEITMTGLRYAEPDVWASVVTDPALRQVATSVTVTAYLDGDTGVEAVTREDPFEAARVLDDVIERHMGVEIAPYGLENETKTSGLTGSAPAREIYEVLRAEFPLAAARVREGSVYLTLPDVTPGATAHEVHPLQSDVSPVPQRTSARRRAARATPRPRRA